MIKIPVEFLTSHNEIHISETDRFSRKRCNSVVNIILVASGRDVEAVARKFETQTYKVLDVPRLSDKFRQQMWYQLLD